MMKKISQSMKRLLIIGAGGHGRSVAEAAALSGEYEVVGFLDDGATESTISDIPVLGRVANLSDHLSKADAVHVAIGRNSLRGELCKKALLMGAFLATVIHPRAVISPRAVIGRGCAIMPGAVIGTDAWLGVGVIVNCGGVVDHDCRVGDYAHLGINASMAGGSSLGEYAWMKAGSVLAPGLRVESGEEVLIGERRAWEANAVIA